MAIVAIPAIITSCGDDELSPNGSNGKAPSGVKAVDLGLPSGTLWANMNVGAFSEEAPGNSYAWGETEVKTTYSWSTYKWYNRYNGDYYNMTKYNLSDKLTELEPEDDAAYVNWGKQWRMPSEAQFEELINHCSWNWTMQNGVNGYKVVGPNGNSIFMPTTAGSYGYYWSRALYAGYPYRARYLDFNSSSIGTSDYNRCYGRSVRPVRLSN